MKRILLSLLAVTALIFCTTPSYSNSTSYFLDINNSSLPGGPWGKITLTENGSYQVDFIVDPYATAFTSTSNFGAQDFAFNVFNVDGSQLDITNLPADWNHTYSDNSIGGFGPYGKFDISTVGLGSSRQDPLTFSVEVIGDAFGISLSTFTNDFSFPGDKLFASHIAGFTLDDFPGVTSAMFSTTGVPENPIPEPATLLLLGSGLIGLAGLARKRFKK